MIPYARQDISEADIEAVIDALRSDFITQGPAVEAFEAALSAYCGASHAVAMNSATSALHLACLALGVGPGDFVWTSPITFVATANCAIHCGAQVDFVDIDPLTWNLSVERLAEKLAIAEAEARLPKVVIPVHFGGQPCEMEGVGRLADRYGFKVIEDASHAVGARYQGDPVGGGRFSDITVFSFHPVKIITTGEGGMAMTQDARLAASMRRLRSHGITRNAAEMTRAPDGPWHYEQVELGFNHRMTDVQAALGSSQLKRLDAFVARRHQIARRYDELLSGDPVATQARSPDSLSSLHLYPVRLRLDRIRPSRREVFQALRQSGIGVNVHYIPVYHQPFYRQMGFPPGYCPEAEKYYAQALSLPMFPALTDAQQDEVAGALRAAIEHVHA